MADKKTDEAPRADAPRETLNPMEMPDRGQQLPDGERQRVERAAALAETRRRHEAEAKAAEVELLMAQRDDAQAEQDRRRAQAMKEADAQRQGFAEQRERYRGYPVDPGALALEASLNAQLAAALEQDETVPGGAYIVGDEIHDADGRVIGRVRD